jgi:hypothetical protein
MLFLTITNLDFIGIFFNSTDAPIITCQPTYAQTGDKSISIRCDVRAKPEVIAMFWIIDTNGTTVSQGEVINEYWTEVVVCLLIFTYFH